MGMPGIMQPYLALDSLVSPLGVILPIGIYPGFTSDLTRTIPLLTNQKPGCYGTVKGHKKRTKWSLDRAKHPDIIQLSEGVRNKAPVLHW